MNIQEVVELEYKVNLKQDYENYKKNLSYIEADAPIQVLCLPKAIENILIKNRLSRVFDLRIESLKGIKLLGNKRLDLILHAVNRFNFG